MNTPFNDRGLPTATGSYATGVTYWPHGGMRQLTFGNGLVEREDYNSRLQANLLQLGQAGDMGKLGTDGPFSLTSGVRGWCTIET